LLQEPHTQLLLALAERPAQEALLQTVATLYFLVLLLLAAAVVDLARTTMAAMADLVAVVGTTLETAEVELLVKDLMVLVVNLWQLHILAVVAVVLAALAQIPTLEAETPEALAKRHLLAAHLHITQVAALAATIQAEPLEALVEAVDLEQIMAEQTLAAVVVVLLIQAQIPDQTVVLAGLVL
jgi:hypothetical protein